MFGAKLLTPFGFMGQFARRRFRQRLRDHYYTPVVQSDAATSQATTNSPSGIKMNQFLLDYVLDMGPAFSTSTGVLRNDAESLQSTVELGDPQCSSQDSSNSPPVLTIDESSFAPNLSEPETRKSIESHNEGIQTSS
ncbi:hypothetical protein FS749_007686 [Ceratobasidium sp. UAMH 11750]|nr:hypothetical protein FS749_007686 [Ceratobasidium sp. UAMH 11750]